MLVTEVTKSMVLELTEWRKRIHVTNPDQFVEANPKILGLRFFVIVVIVVTHDSVYMETMCELW